MIEWEPMKEVVLKGIFKGVQAVEFFTFLGVPDEVFLGCSNCCYGRADNGEGRLA